MGGGSAGGSGAVLGISCDYHDAAAALIVDGSIVAAIEQERLSRRKHDAGLPEDAVRACLDLGAIAAADLEHVVFYEKPLALASRFVATRQRQGPSGFRAFKAGAPDLVGRNLFVGARIAAMLRRQGARRPPPVQFVEHHLSHAAAAFLPSPFEHAAVLTLDGLGEWATATIGVGAQQRVSILEEQRFPNSIGLVYSFITAWCGFEANGDEYKLMGLAPYGEDRFADALGRLVRLDDDGTIRVDAAAMGWFDLRSRRARALADVLGGPPRAADAPISQRDVDLAASIQRLTERAVLAMARRAHRTTGERALCLAGGVALNSVANGVLAREGPFEEIWVQPAAGDAGSALGAALALWHDERGHPRPHLDRSSRPGSDGMRGALLGTEVDDAGILAELERAAVPHEVIEDRAQRDALVAERLEAGDVVAVFQGRMEFGPRALGNRSILADPRSPDVRQRINLAVKGRESFRPFAPAVLADRAADWFELEGPSPYMLVVAPVRAEHLLAVDVEPGDLEGRSQVPRSTIPACTHVDGSARVQTVDAATHPGLHGLLEAFRERTGCPVLLNTSFNRAGEPIVESVAQALATAARAEIDLLVVGPAIVRRPGR